MGVFLSERAADLAHSYATETVLEDVDSYTDWLGGQCMRKPAVVLGHVPYGDEFHGFITEADVPTLVALTLYPAPRVAGYAALELRKRYIKTQSERISEVAAELRPAVEDDLRSPE